MRTKLSLLTFGALVVAAFGRAVAGEPELTLTANFHQDVQVLRGGLGASWHAMETPIPVVGERSHGGSGWGGYH